MWSPLRFVSVKLYLLLLAGVILVFSIHTYVNIKTTSASLTDYVYASAGRASDLIVRSTRYSMLLNRKEDVHQTINTLGSEPGFVDINIYNKVGEIIFSTDSLKVGQKVDLDAEACNICHSSDAPLVSVPAKGRMRVYTSPAQGRILGLINPIRNEPECYNGECHAHSPEQTVLGVLDVKMSLAAVDQRVAHVRSTMIVSSLTMLVLMALIPAVFIYRVISKPIRRLKDGMMTVAAGDLDTRIGLQSQDEIGDLAQALDSMTGDLKTAHDELREWGRTLEQRIASKTDELEQAQAQIVHMEKMASLGTLSASVAHEINNPLFAILTYAKLSLRDLDTDSLDEAVKAPLRKYLSCIREESEHCGDIVKHLLEFARHTGGEFEEHNLNHVVEQTLFLLVHHFEMQQVTVKRELMSGDDAVFCDAKQLQQALIALCINAVEAMPSGGSLTIRTSGVDDKVVVEIIDTGIGIGEEVLPRIFEPFFSTKDAESGTGLGLAIVYGIVQRHRGRIDVRSKPDEGTRVTITLPRKRDAGEDPGTRGA